MQIKVLQVVLAILLAIVPAGIWGKIFYAKQPEKKSVVIHLFIMGALSVTPLLAYKYLWKFFPWINAFLYANTFKADMVGFQNVALIPINIIITFMLVGVIEEVSKYFAVRNADEAGKSISDYVEFFVIVGLGFAFIENIIYFYNILVSQGTEAVFAPFLFRSMFSTLAHVMFSGICGYYYGIAKFAPIFMLEKHAAKKWTFVQKAGRMIGIKREFLFSEEKKIQGIIVASALHAMFNIFLEMGWTFMIVPFLTVGFIVLNKMLDLDKIMSRN